MTRSNYVAEVRPAQFRRLRFSQNKFWQAAGPIRPERILKENLRCPHACCVEVLRLPCAPAEVSQTSGAGMLDCREQL
jgi:hypothetical protein